MADKQQGQTEVALQIFHQIEDLRLHRHIECRGRLVTDDHIGIGRQRTGNGDALPLPAGKLVRKFDRIGGIKPDQFQQLADAAALLFLVAGQPEGLHRLGDDRTNPPARIKAGIGILKDHLQAAAQGQRIAGFGIKRHIINRKRAGTGRQQAGHHTGHGGFARSRFPDQRKGLALSDRERHIIDRHQHLFVLTGQHAF